MPQISVPSAGVIGVLPANYYRWPPKLVQTIDTYSIDFAGWLEAVANDTLTACSLVATPAGAGQLVMSATITIAGSVASCLIGRGAYGQDYALVWTAITSQGRALAVVTMLYCAADLLPTIEAEGSESVATATTPGVVSVPIGGGLAVGPDGSLSLSGVALPTSPAGLPSGAVWNDGGVLALVP